MCGIIGYIGEKDSTPILLDGLKRLEYRGYDSAGIAVLDNDSEVKIIRKQGHLDELIKIVMKNAPHGGLGIGHTRWATHGRPCERNAHPHVDCTGTIAIVHNGIIENFSSLREQLESKGHRFTSETDTETIAHLIEESYSGDLSQAVREALKKVKGSFALAVICKNHPNEMVAARKDSPLILGVGKREYFIASDIPALLPHTREVIILEDGEVAEVTRSGIKITTLDNQPISRETFRVKWDLEAAEKAGYDDFMLKEIYEQPVAIRETMRGRIATDGRILLDEVELTEDQVKNLDKVFVVACGTSFHAGLVGKYVIERWARIPVEIEISSEFRYREPVINSNTLVIAITQSGETADTMAAVRQAKQKGAKVVAITNVVGSSVTREADGILYTHAGLEIGVAATKTLVAQMVALYLLALYLGDVRAILSREEVNDITAGMRLLPEKAEKVLADTDYIKDCAQKYANRSNFLFLGRGVGLPVALEGALKLKEISYVHAEGNPAGEMKHGPIALIDKDFPVVAVCTKGSVYDKIMGNIQEVKARGAKVITVATEGDQEIKRQADHIFYIPKTPEFLSPVPAVIPLQLFAYYIAKLRGCNVDQPRNLAKSVTVE
ncbi:MAG: glutamine--fructose-6-phosphate transaminase (isomerizing) [Actinomycetota bacterium]